MNPWLYLLLIGIGFSLFLISGYVIETDGNLDNEYPLGMIVMQMQIYGIALMLLFSLALVVLIEKGKITRQM